MSASAPQPINEAKLHDFVMKAVGEMGAAMNAAAIPEGAARHVLGTLARTAHG